MILPDDEPGRSRRHDSTVRFLVGEAEVWACSGDRRGLCILAEEFLRHMHARGLRPRRLIRAGDESDGPQIALYLDDVARELDAIL